MIPERELRTRYPMTTLTVARLTYLNLKRDYNNGEIDIGTYKEAKIRLFARWPELKPKAWQ